MALAENELFVGRFRVGKLLGEGGMGEVYEVVDETKFRGERFAIKVLLPAHRARPAMRARFAREAEATARIRSDHVIHVRDYDASDATPTPWILMERLEGRTLDAHVRELGALSLNEARRYAVEIGHAMRAAHNANVLHLDLKPENVFLQRMHDAYSTTRVKVIDFGIAREIDAHQSHAYQSHAMGSHVWMSPEQLNDDTMLRKPADVWAMGLVVFWMLTAKHYWRSVSDNGSVSLMPLLGEFTTGAAAQPASRRAADRGCTRELPDGFDAWFEKCVNPDLAARWSDCGAASDALDG